MLTVDFTSMIVADKPREISSQVSPWLSGLLYPLGRSIVLPLQFRSIHVEGAEHIPRSGGVILAPTHRSRWDSVILALIAGKPVTGRDLRFMVSANEVKGIQGWFIRRLGGFPVDTSRAGIASLRHTVELLSQGEMLVIFPEGGIFRTSEVQNLKPGLCRLALQTVATQENCELNVVPISIQYDQVYPTIRSNVVIKIGKPLSVAPYYHGSVKKDAESLTDDLKLAMINLSL